MSHAHGCSICLTLNCHFLDGEGLASVTTTGSYSMSLLQQAAVKTDSHIDNVVSDK